jgi:hypothetical protein
MQAVVWLDRLNVWEGCVCLDFCHTPNPLAVCFRNVFTSTPPMAVTVDSSRQCGGISCYK